MFASLFNSLLSVFASRLFWGGMGIAALSMLIWTAGPLLAVGDLRPLESEVNRTLTITLICLLWGLARLLPALYRSWRNRHLLKRMSQEGESAAGGGQGAEPRLRERFEEATRLLRRMRFDRDARASGWPRWLFGLLRFGRQHLYQLPWYVIIGAPGAGKTTALVNSGLHFPLAERFGSAALRGVGGTRNCDWWFTDEAVLLDTAGRYTTQESQREQDAGEWLGFLGLLRKYRARQPINGVLVTISIADLLGASEAELYEQAQALHRRLLELHEQLKIDFPVYVLLTKADLLDGFAAYFADLDAEQRAQVWGFTFPRAWGGQADFDLPGAYDQEFALLHDRLQSALPEVLGAASGLAERGACYRFPQEFLALREPLKAYLLTVFASSSFESASFTPRGIYFTSGTQEGQPFDRVMGELNRYLGLAAPAPGQAAGEQAALPERGRSFFLLGVLREVVFREAGLAGSNRWWEYRNRALHWLGYLCLLLALGAAGFCWAWSYRNNLAYLDEVRAKVAPLERQGETLQRLDAQDFFRLLPYLDDILHLPQSQQFALQAPPGRYGFGLYRGELVGSAGQALYRRALKELLLPLAAFQVQHILRQDPRTDPDFSFEALKAYRMLYLPEQYDGRFLRAWLIYNLQRSQPQAGTKAQWQQLEWHLGQLLDEQVQASPYLRDEKLEDAVRAYLAQVPLAQRIYGRLKRMLLKPEALKSLSVAELAGPQAELAFKRRSGLPLGEGLPGLFTPQGYWLAFDKQLPGVVEVLGREDGWVLGFTAQAEAREDVEKTVRLLYMRDFIRTWDGLLADLELTNVASLAQRIGTARLLSAADSPLRRLLLNLVKNVNLTDERVDRAAKSLVNEKASASPSSPGGLFDALFSQRESHVEIDAASQPEQVVINHYGAFIELAGSPGADKAEGGIPFDAVLKQTDGLYNYLTAVQGAANSGMPVPAGDVITRLQAEAGRLPQPFQGMLLSLSVGASTDTQLQEMESTRRRIGAEVGSFCRQAIAGRYPLQRGAAMDIAAADFARMFAPNKGLMESFFRQNLEGRIDTSGRTWRFNPGVDGKTLPGGEGLLRAFQQARSIRDTYFNASQELPGYRLTVTPVSMDSEVLNMVLDVDGQVLRYSHGPQVPMAIGWPGTRNSSRVNLQLNLVNGASSSLGTTGDWALNRLLDKARLAPGSSRLSRLATFELDGRRVTLEFTPNSIRNPFEAMAFNCP